MPRQRRAGWVNWRKSEARAVIMQDLEDGVLPVDENACSAEDAFQIYRQYAQFAGIKFDQFKERLKGHREQLQKLHERSNLEAEALACDRQLYPRNTHNQRGEPVFDLSEAKYLLREDVKDKKHTTVTAEALRQSRPQYRVFESEIFRRRIKQEVRRQEFVYYLSLKRPDASNDWASYQMTTIISRCFGYLSPLCTVILVYSLSIRYLFNPNIHPSPNVSTRLQMSPTVSKCLQPSPNVSIRRQMSPTVSKCLPPSPNVSNRLQMSPPISTLYPKCL